VSICSHMISSVFCEVLLLSRAAKASNFLEFGFEVRRRVHIKQEVASVTGVHQAADDYSNESSVGLLQQKVAEKSVHND
jgi:hypothetical protein